MKNMGVKLSLVLCSSPSFDRCEKRTITFSVRVYDIWRDSAVSEERSVEHLQCSSLTKIVIHTMINREIRTLDSLWHRSWKRRFESGCEVILDSTRFI
jgi:hypothetical protein